MKITKPNLDVKSVCFVYWIHTDLQKDFKTQGYIGISFYPEARFQQHRQHAASDLRNCPYRSEFIESLNSELCIMEVIYKGSREECLNYEFQLRPSWVIGWNIAKGGAGGVGKQVHEIDDKLFSVIELATIFNIKPNTISTRLKRGYSILEATGLKTRKIQKEFDCEKEMAIFYLENSPMTSNQISKLMGYNSCLKRVLSNYKLPLWIFDEFEYQDETRFSVRKLPRNRLFSEMTEFLEIENSYLEGAAIHAIAKEMNVSHGSIEKVLQDMGYV